MSNPSNNSGQKTKDIVYIGNDTAYWTTIQRRFQSSYPQAAFKFTKYFEKDSLKTQKTFLDILENEPHIVYIDLSTRTSEHLFLAQLLTRDNGIKDLPIVGLVDKKEYVRDCLSAGVDFIHVKCGEYHDVVYHPFLLAFPKEAGTPQFANAKFSNEVHLIDDFRVGFISPISVHAEGNLVIEKGETIELQHEFPSEFIKSNKFIVKESLTSNLYYDFKFAYELEPVFLDEPEFSEEEFDDALGEDDEAKKIKSMKKAKELRKHKIQEHKETLIWMKKKHRDWVVGNIDAKAEKTTKILIVDSKLRILREENTKPLDSYPFGIRCQTVLSETLREIDSIRPNIIAIQFFSDFSEEEDPVFFEVFNEFKNGVYADGIPEQNPEPEPESKTEGEGDEKEAEEEIESIPAISDDKMGLIEAIKGIEHEEMDQLSEIIKKVKGLDNYNPFIVVFNCYFKTSTALQDGYQYPLIVVHKEDMTMDAVLNISTVFQQKQEAKYEEKIKSKVMELKKKDTNKYRNLTVDDFREKRFFIKKTNKISYASCQHNIILESLTESECTFLADEELELKTYRLDFPLEMSIRIILNEGKAFVDKAGQKQYKALIHSIDEEDKKFVRRYINEIFAEPLKEKREQEQSEWNDRKTAAIAERDKLDEYVDNKKASEAADTLGSGEISSQIEGEGKPDEPVPEEDKDALKPGKD